MLGIGHPQPTHVRVDLDEAHEIWTIWQLWRLLKFILLRKIVILIVEYKPWSLKGAIWISIVKRSSIGFV